MFTLFTVQDNMIDEQTKCFLSGLDKIANSKENLRERCAGQHDRQRPNCVFFSRVYKIANLKENQRERCSGQHD